MTPPPFKEKKNEESWERMLRMLCAILLILEVEKRLCQCLNDGANIFVLKKS